MSWNPSDRFSFSWIIRSDYLYLTSSYITKNIPNFMLTCWIKHIVNITLAVVATLAFSVHLHAPCYLIVFNHITSVGLCYFKRNEYDLQSEAYRWKFCSNEIYGFGLHLLKTTLSHQLYLLFNQRFSDKGHQETSKLVPQIFAHLWSERPHPKHFCLGFLRAQLLTFSKIESGSDKLGPGIMRFIPQCGLRKPEPFIKQDEIQR